MKKIVTILLTVASAALFSNFASPVPAHQQKTEKHPEVDFSQSCVECHTDVTPDVVKEWKNSKHGIMNFGCYMCHGDGQVEFYAKPGTQRCISCHPEYDVDYSKTKVSNCYDCHQGHSLKFHKIDK